MTIEQLLVIFCPSLLSGLIGILVGHRLAFNFGRLAKFEDQFVQLNLKKFEKLNNLWDKLCLQYLFIGHEKSFVERWNAKEPSVFLQFNKDKEGIDKAYYEVGFLMSKQMGAIFEYISRCLIEKVLFESNGTMAQISKPTHEKLLIDLDRYQQLMMDLLKLECNSTAIESILYSRFENYNKAVKNFKVDIDLFLEKHKVEFAHINESLNSFAKP